ncbi:hypothetical protein ACHAWT_000699 [Skeletonema menzelii]
MLTLHRSVTTALFLLIVLAIGQADLLIDGGDSGWQTGSWYSQVDGVMGGKSSGELTFLESNTIMSFSGIISLDGGGFSSVRKPFSNAIDLSPYAGFVVELETTRAHDPNTIDAPLGLHLQFHDSFSRYIGYASAFAVPLSSSVGETVSVYLPQTSFDRGSWIGRVCNDCQINFSSIVEVDLYVLFQDGPFEVRLRKISAVNDPQTFASPVISLLSNEEIKTLIDKTIQSGGGLYDKGYHELCIALYGSVLNTILAANCSDATVSKRIKNVICQGLQREADVGSKVNKAWTLRYTLDALLDEMGFNVTSNEQAWRPDPTLNDHECVQWTSGAYILHLLNESTESMSETTARSTPSPSLVPFIPPSLNSPIANTATSRVETTSMPSLVAFPSSATEFSETPENAKVTSFTSTNDADTSGTPTASASVCSIPYALIVTIVMILAASSTIIITTKGARPPHQPQLNVTPPPPELNRVPLPVMLAGGLFLFATSVPSSQKSRADKLLRLAQEVLRSDPTVTMELGPGIESGNVYASSNGKDGEVHQLVLQFQINGGNAWAQGCLYGVEDETGVRLISLEVANMDAVLNNQSFQVPLNT